MCQKSWNRKKVGVGCWQDDKKWPNLLVWTDQQKVGFSLVSSQSCQGPPLDATRKPLGCDTET